MGYTSVGVYLYCEYALVFYTCTYSTECAIAFLWALFHDGTSPFCAVGRRMFSVGKMWTLAWSLCIRWGWCSVILHARPPRITSVPLDLFYALWCVILLKRRRLCAWLRICSSVQTLTVPVNLMWVLLKGVCLSCMHLHTHTHTHTYACTKSHGYKLYTNACT